MLSASARLLNAVLAIMIVPDEVRKCVAFVGLQMADESFRLCGTAFFFGLDDASNRITEMWAVTAKHVIDGIRNKGLNKTFLRLNTDSGEAIWAEAPIEEWFCHPTDASIDVAVLRLGMPNGADHRVLPLSLCATDEQMKEHEIGVGDEVFVTGLFRHHHGTKRYIPIVRVGNLACLTEERVVTQGFGEMDAYPVEARSIGGLSGSPVFVNLGSMRSKSGGLTIGAGGPRFLLFGLIHGHYDVDASELDELDQDTIVSSQREHVNTGIAIVVPFNSFFSVVQAWRDAQS